MKREMMGWQWHQLDHMQITRTSLQTDVHASTSSFKVKEQNQGGKANPAFPNQLQLENNS